LNDSLKEQSVKVFLMGVQPTAGRDSSLYRHLAQDELFDPKLLAMIWQYCQPVGLRLLDRQLSIPVRQQVEYDTQSELEMQLKREVEHLTAISSAFGDEVDTIAPPGMYDYVYVSCTYVCLV
jgi:hypothetical protein